MSTLRFISATDLHERLEQGGGAVIIDVREPEEYRALHAAGALLLPLAEVSADTVAERLAASGHSAASDICLICHSGRRAGEAGERISDRFPTATVVEGGTLAWAQAGLPVHSGDEP